MSGPGSDDEDYQPRTLANMIRKKIAEHKGAGSVEQPKEEQVPEDAYIQRLAGNEPQVGSVLDSYELLHLMHTGETTNIFLAKHSLMEKRVVVKILRSEHVLDTFLVKRLQEEAKTMAGIKHHKIANTIDFGISTSGHPYMIMMPAEAVSLREMLAKNGKPPTMRALQIVEQLAQILTYLHQSQIKYANLKPGHVLIQDADKDTFSLMLVDFSLARREDTILPQSVTSLDGAPYMSPEHACEEKIEVASDVYSLGCLAFELLTGKAPFAEQSLHEYKKAHTFDPPVSIDNRTLPAEVHQVLLKAMSKIPANRYPTAQEFAGDLRAKIESNCLS